jgi:hypothetical protein
MLPRITDIFMIKEAKSCSEEDENEIGIKAKNVHLDVVGPKGEHDIDEASHFDPRFQKLIDDYVKVITMKGGIAKSDPRTIERLKDVLKEFAMQVSSMNTGTNTFKA